MSVWKQGDPALDVAHEAKGVEYVPSKITDFGKLRIDPPLIRYKLYSQDGSFIEMDVLDTYSNRLLVSWVQIHDRYVVHGPGGRQLAAPQAPPQRFGDDTREVTTNGERDGQ